MLTAKPNVPHPQRKGNQRLGPHLSISSQPTKPKLVTSLVEHLQEKANAWTWAPPGAEQRRCCTSASVSSQRRVRGQKLVTIGSSWCRGFQLCSPLPASLWNTAFYKTHLSCFVNLFVIRTNNPSLWAFAVYCCKTPLKYDWNVIKSSTLFLLC